mgnify:FL=1
MSKISSQSYAGWTKVSTNVGWKKIFDLIGDIHGQAIELEVLLDKLGYKRSGNLYRHQDRMVIFLGDFIDRGPYQKRTLELVRAMIDAGAAKAVMGNHEYNAIAYFTANDEGGDLRFIYARLTIIEW